MRIVLDNLPPELEVALRRHAAAIGRSVEDVTISILWVALLLPESWRTMNREEREQILTEIAAKREADPAFMKSIEEFRELTAAFNS